MPIETSGSHCSSRGRYTWQGGARVGPRLRADAINEALLSRSHEIHTYDGPLSHHWRPTHEISAAAVPTAHYHPPPA